MMTTVLIAGGLAAVVVLLYNRLVRDRNRVDGAWSDIDVQLQRRHDLIPQIVKAVNQYAKYEKATLDAVTTLRAEAVQMAGTSNAEVRGEKEEQLSAGILRLIALAENYPDLKANENFLGLQNELVQTENYLQFARRFYNGSVRGFNTRVESVPSNFVANIFGFRQKPYFQKTSDDAANVPLVEFGKIE